MRKHTLAAAAGLSLLACTAAAQSSVTLYGFIDTGVERVSNANGTNSSLTRMPGQTGGLGPSRWGVRGTEDLGGGLRANFMLEGGFSPDKGTNSTSQGGRLFGRSSWVGVSGPWGSLSVGRQLTMFLWSMMDADPMGPAIYGLGNLDSGIPSARSDNSIAYKGTFSGVTLGATYSFGRDATSCAGEQVGNFKACKEVSAMAKYDTAAWGVALAFDEQRGGTGGLANLTASTQTDRRKIANGYAVLGPVRLAAGLIKRDNDGVTTTTVTPKSNLTYIEADWSVTPAITVTPLLARLKYQDSTDGSKSTLYSVRAAYAFTKRTSAYITSGRMQNRGSANNGVSSGTLPPDLQPTGPGGGRGQTGVMVGVRHSF